MTRNISRPCVRAAVAVLGLSLGGCASSGRGGLGGPPPDRAAFETTLLITIKKVTLYLHAVSGHPVRS